MSKYKMDKVTITTRKGNGAMVRTLPPKEIKENTKYSTFHYGGKEDG